MRIGIDIRLIGKNRTGDEIVFFNLVKNIAKIDNSNKYLLFTDTCNKAKIEEIASRLGIKNKKNFEIVSLETGNKFMWNFWILPKYLRKNTVDVYLTQYITPFFVSRKTKIITIIHDISFNFFPQFIRKTDLFFLKILIPLSIRRADKILGVSEFTKDEIVNFYKVDATKVDFFHNAASEDFNREISSSELEEVRNKYNLPEKYILYLGTMQPRKNIPNLIMAYAKIKDRLSDTSLVVVGNKNAHNFDKRIDEQIGKLKLENNVLFPGFIDEQDKAAVFRLAHVFVFPSLYEGFGIPVLEAFLAGTPVLASDIESLREVAEKSALFADASDVDKFSKSLYDISIENNLRNSLVGKGFKRADFFSWQKTAQKVISIIQSIK